MREEARGERKLVRGRGGRKRISKDPNLSAGKRSDNAVEHRPNKKSRKEPLVIEKTP